jgi:hypothetical protein
MSTGIQLTDKERSELEALRLGFSVLARYMNDTVSNVHPDENGRIPVQYMNEVRLMLIGMGNTATAARERTILT